MARQLKVNLKNKRTDSTSNNIKKSLARFPMTDRSLRSKVNVARKLPTLENDGKRTRCNGTI